MVSKRLAGALALCLLASALASAPGGKELPGPPASAGLTVRAGRATLVQRDGAHVLTRSSARRDVAGAAYAELGALGELELSWPGSASLRVLGPAALEWGPSGDLRVLRAARFELEVRRGARTVALPGGWSATGTRGAIGGAERASGDWIVENRGGADVALRRDGAGAGTLGSGRQALLPAAR